MPIIKSIFFFYLNAPNNLFSRVSVEIHPTQTRPVNPVTTCKKLNSKAFNLEFKEFYSNKFLITCKPNKHVLAASSGPFRVKIWSKKSRITR